MAFEIVTTKAIPLQKQLKSRIRLYRNYFVLTLGTINLLALKKPNILVLKNTETNEYYLAAAPDNSPQAYTLTKASGKMNSALKLSNNVLCNEIRQAYGLKDDNYTFNISQTSVKAMGLDAYLLIKS